MAKHFIWENFIWQTSFGEPSFGETLFSMVWLRQSFARYSTGYARQHTNTQKQDFDQTFWQNFLLGKLYLANSILRSFIWRNAFGEASFSKLHLASIGCAKPFSGSETFLSLAMPGYFSLKSVTVTK